MENANPTILNITELPTRRGRDGASKKKVPGSEIQALMEMKSRYIIQGSEFSDPDSGLESEEDGAVESIDEQEIYGVSFLALIHADSDASLQISSLPSQIRSIRSHLVRWPS